MKNDNLFFYKEIKKSAYRVGIDSKEQMKWLLRFTQQDIINLSVGNFLNLQYEILFFEYIDNFVCGSDLLPFGMPDEFGIFNRSNYRILNLKDIIKHQNFVKSALICILSKKKRFIIEIPDVSINFTPPSSINPKWHTYIGFSEGKTSFSYQFGACLKSNIEYLRQCSGCHIIFLADRINQNYCTVKCQSRHYMRQYRDTPPERIGKRGRPPSALKETSEKKGDNNHGKKTR